MTIPAFVICRDLVGWTRRTVAALEATVGVGDIFLVDNASTYPPLVSWYRTTPHRVIKLRGNFGKRGPWQRGVIQRHAGSSPFIVTDPDVIPDLDCPDDWVAVFLDALEANPELAKVGFSLRIDNLPAHYEYSDAVIQRQHQFWAPELLTPDGRFYRTVLDTTLAVYPPGAPYATRPAFRSAAPYVALHLPWYLKSLTPTPELNYYRSHADPRFGHWSKKHLPKRLRSTLDKRF